MATNGWKLFWDCIVFSRKNKPFIFFISGSNWPNEYVICMCVCVFFFLRVLVKVETPFGEVGQKGGVY